jgi:hypothetical protein
MVLGPGSGKIVSTIDIETEWEGGGAKGVYRSEPMDPGKMFVYA